MIPLSKRCSLGLVWRCSRLIFRFNPKQAPMAEGTGMIPIQEENVNRRKNFSTHTTARTIPLTRRRRRLIRRMNRAVPSIYKLTTLLHLASPVLPIGGFSYSQGLEAAVDARIIHNATTARHWIEEGLRHVLAVNELPMLAHFLRHWETNDFSELQRWNAVFLSSRETSELRGE